MTNNDSKVSKIVDQTMELELRLKAVLKQFGAMQAELENLAKLAGEVSNAACDLDWEGRDKARAARRKLEKIKVAKRDLSYYDSFFTRRAKQEDNAQG